MDSKWYPVLAIIIIIVFVITLLLLCSRRENYETVQNQIEDADNKHTLMLFYTNWCGYSQQFLPIWHNMIATYDKIKYEKYDCDTPEGRKLCEQYHITGYPTIIIKTHDNTIIKYPDNHPRTKTAIISFLNQLS